MKGHFKRAVSFDNDLLVLVDSEDNERGYAPKLFCHQNEGVLHRAFSVFLFNNDEKVLLQQRSSSKMLWPLTWSNSCCSHPRKGELMVDSIHRRVAEELNIENIESLYYVYTFQYSAKYKDVGIEKEVCSVFVGKICKTEINPNLSEIAAIKFSSVDEIDSIVEESVEEITPWMAMEWKTLRQEHWSSVIDILQN
jgi:isopentenyl-diphosphate delta-isomerase